MTRSKATAACWVQPRGSVNTSGVPRRSPGLRKEEASDSEPTPEQTLLPTNLQSASLLFNVPPEIRDYIFGRRVRRDKYLCEMKRAGKSGDPYRYKGPYPKTMMITTRHCDWTWRSNNLLDIGSMILNEHLKIVLGGFNEPRIEMDAQDGIKEVLLPVINKLKDFGCGVGEGEVLIPEENVQEKRWVGPLKCHSDNLPGYAWTETEYYAATVVWKTGPIAQSSAD